MLTVPTPHRAIQLETYLRATYRVGRGEQIGSAYVGKEIGAAVMQEYPNEIVAPDTMPIVVIMATSTRRRQDFDLLGRKMSAPLPSDAIIVVPKGQQSWWASAEPMRNLHVHIQSAYLDNLDIDVKDVDQPRFGINDPILSRLGRLIEATLSNSDGQSLFLDHLLLAFAVRVFSPRNNLPSAPRGGLSAWAARRCIEYLESRLSEKVTVSELAAIASLSPYHFVRMFQQTTGYPPVRYQQRLRMEKAKTLLATTDLSVTAIAASVGYETPGAFARAFRTYTGVAPQRWRRRP